jgi:hypothetical protein
MEELEHSRAEKGGISPCFLVCVKVISEISYRNFFVDKETVVRKEQIGAIDLLSMFLSYYT